MNKIFQTAEETTWKSELRWLRPGGCPYVGSLAARPPEPPGSPAPHRRRVVSAINAAEIYKSIELFILQIIKSMKCSWHSFNNIKFPLKTFKKLHFRFAGNCCIAFPIPIAIKKLPPPKIFKTPAPKVP